MIARLLGDKGVREYGEAARQLKARHPEAAFRLVGYFDQSPDAIGTEELAEMERGGVDFLGKLDDVRPAIAGASVYVLPSYREGTPRSVLEAMAMGRAIVTTDAPGCRQTVRNGENGFLAAPRDASSLEAAMERLIAAPELIPPMGAASRKMAEEIFDVHQVNNEIIAAAGL
jgi:glycosyltransferase involved in cell wall biosynthesis